MSFLCFELVFSLFRIGFGCFVGSLLHFGVQFVGIFWSLFQRLLLVFWNCLVPGCKSISVRVLCCTLCQVVLLSGCLVGVGRGPLCNFGTFGAVSCSHLGRLCSIQATLLSGVVFENPRGGFATPGVADWFQAAISTAVGAAPALEVRTST